MIKTYLILNKYNLYKLGIALLIILKLPPFPRIIKVGIFIKKIKRHPGGC